MNSIQGLDSLRQLAADFTYASGPGAQHAGHKAVQDGATLVERESRTIDGASAVVTVNDLSASIGAPKTYGVYQEQNPGVEMPPGLLDAMADDIAELGLEAVINGH